MTREEAEAELVRRQREQPEDGWLVRETSQGWELVRLPGMGRDATAMPATEAKPKPPQADDPRSSFVRNVGGPWAGGA